MACLGKDGGVMVTFFSAQALGVFKVEGGDHERMPTWYVRNKHDGAARRVNGDSWEFFAEVLVYVI